MVSEIDEKVNKTELIGKTTIKAQYGDEIKKFSIHNDDLTYDELILMMQRVFKDHIDKNDELLLKYKDEDGDYITLTDNAELNTALEKGSILKLMITSNKEHKLETQDIKLIRKELQTMRDKINYLLDCLELKNFKKDEDDNVIKHMQNEIEILKNKISDKSQQFDNVNTNEGKIHNINKNLPVVNGIDDAFSKKQPEDYRQTSALPHQMPSKNIPPQIMPTIQHTHLPPPFHPGHQYGGGAVEQMHATSNSQIMSSSSGTAVASNNSYPLGHHPQPAPNDNFPMGTSMQSLPYINQQQAAKQPTALSAFTPESQSMYLNKNQQQPFQQQQAPPPPSGGPPPPPQSNFMTRGSPQPPSSSKYVQQPGWYPPPPRSSLPPTNGPPGGQLMKDQHGGGPPIGGANSYEAMMPNFNGPPQQQQQQQSGQSAYGLGGMGGRPGFQPSNPTGGFSQPGGGPPPPPQFSPYTQQPQSSMPHAM